MKFLDLSFNTPAENLACDEALLDFCEENDQPEILRVWEPQNFFVVVGYSNAIQSEVHFEKCREKQIPVFRRCSGGGTVLQGPGCLNFSLLLKFDNVSALQTITSANQFIMRRQAEALGKLLNDDVRIEGHTDLAVDGRKFSGNAQRRKKRFLLFHGVFLLNFPIPEIEDLLKFPSHQPAYRSSRSHENFLKNIHVSPAELKSVLRSTWEAEEEFSNPPKLPGALVEKYGSDVWNHRF